MCGLPGEAFCMIAQLLDCVKSQLHVLGVVEKHTILSPSGDS